jgi:hypothetical protein
VEFNNINNSGNSENTQYMRTNFRNIDGRLNYSLVYKDIRIKMVPISLYKTDHIYGQKSHELLMNLIEKKPDYDLSKLKIVIGSGWTKFTDEKPDTSVIANALEAVLNLGLEESEYQDYDITNEDYHGYLHLYLQGKKSRIILKRIPLRPEGNRQEITLLKVAELFGRAKKSFDEFAEFVQFEVDSIAIFSEDVDEDDFFE